MDFKKEEREMKMSNNYKTIDEMVKIFRKTYSLRLSEKLENAAAELAKKIAADNGYYPDDTDEDDDEYEHAYNLICKVCRKSLIDGFPIEDYEILEAPYSDSDGVLICWINKKEWGTGESYNPQCHRIDFWCQRDFDIAIPLKLVYNSDEFPFWVNVPFITCGEAIYVSM